MRWWCSSTSRAWDWTPRPYYGVWLLIAVIAAAYWIAVRRHGEPVSRRKAMWFGLGLALLWLASDWPLGPLGAGYLAWVHMTQFMLYTLGAAPLLLLGTPEWMARAIVDRLRLGAVIRVVCHPVTAAILFNGTLIATHAPFTVDRLRTTQAGSFLLDMVWLLAGFVLWIPVIGPLPERVVRAVPARLVYLFLASSLFAMVPGGFITFSDKPLYEIYASAPRVGFTALDDQQLAGVIMKVGNIPLIWTVMTVIYIRWYNVQLVGDRHRQTQLAHDRPAKAKAT